MKNNTKREEEMGYRVKRKERAVVKEGGRPARIVLCEEDWQRICGWIGGEAALKSMRAGEHEAIAVTHAYGADIGMERWADSGGRIWFGPVLIFGWKGDEKAELDADSAEMWRKYMDGDLMGE